MISSPDIDNVAISLYDIINLITSNLHSWIVTVSIDTPQTNTTNSIH